jgi:hypothetical protein
MLLVSLLTLYLLAVALFFYARRSPVVNPWWVKIITTTPSCTYYFGPFNSPLEAQGQEKFYLEDILKEGAKGIKTTIERANPTQLTIFED